jgi:hypothetical protein
VAGRANEWGPERPGPAEPAAPEFAGANLGKRRGTARERSSMATLAEELSVRTGRGALSETPEPGPGSPEEPEPPDPSEPGEEPPPFPADPDELEDSVPA